MTPLRPPVVVAPAVREPAVHQLDARGRHAAVHAAAAPSGLRPSTLICQRPVFQPPPASGGRPPPRRCPGRCLMSGQVRGRHDWGRRVARQVAALAVVDPGRRCSVWSGGIVVMLVRTSSAACCEARPRPRGTRVRAVLEARDRRSSLAASSATRPRRPSGRAVSPRGTSRRPAHAREPSARRPAASSRARARIPGCRVAGRTAAREGAASEAVEAAAGRAFSGAYERAVPGSVLRPGGVLVRGAHDEVEAHRTQEAVVLLSASSR